ncbi:FAD-dependent oxidoreductase [Dechloromonas sp. ZY10]|uniref:FAD-dependent oxidoreductase n=1 Tax=Dechloromonas aquae TaxID=2664436 RepID=UPI003527AC46
MQRRDFLRAGGAGLAFGALGGTLAACAKARPPLPPGELLGGNPPAAHRLRSGDFPAPDEVRQVGIAIVGGGVSGMSAAWQLNKAGIDDFVVLEMESEPGGNSRAGQSPLCAYPWGAHYLPLPGSEARLVRELLAELGVLQGDPGARRPTYDERYLCATPQERVFRDGLWEEGLLPQLGLDTEERAQQRRFAETVDAMKRQRGRDGLRVFALPLALASRDPAWLALDRISFASWLKAQGFTAPSLHWLANYACRDDYGLGHGETSAWAGLHYFACRNGEAANAAGDCVLTAPEGNAWLLRGLAAHAAGRIVTDALVWRIDEEKGGFTVDCLCGEKSRRYHARKLLWAAPAFVLPHVWRNAPGPLKAAAGSGDYAPWLVANLHLDRLPQQRHGAAPAWDNVLYEGVGLGYVDATHQLLRRHHGASIYTYYRPLNELAPAAARQLLLNTSQAAWAESILGELERVHPDLREVVSRLDVMRYGHAMRRPLPGSLFASPRQTLLAFRHPRLALAHADLSGISLFEEAQYRGVQAARQLLGRGGVVMG